MGYWFDFWRKNDIVSKILFFLDLYVNVFILVFFNVIFIGNRVVIEVVNLIWGFSYLLVLIL